MKLHTKRAALAAAALCWHALALAQGHDADQDGVDDLLDNCLQTANVDQRDTDHDGIGNACDPDLNQDGAVNFADLAKFKSVFLTQDPDADFNGDGTVNFRDLATIKAHFFGPPGPSNATPDVQFVTAPPPVATAQLYTTTFVLPDGINGAAYLELPQDADVGETIVVHPDADSSPIVLNDVGLEPDWLAGDGIYGGFVTLDTQEIVGDENAYLGRLQQVRDPRVTSFSGRDVVGEQPFGPDLVAQRVEANAEFPPVIMLPSGIELRILSLPLTRFKVLAPTADAEKTLMITDLDVVADPTRTYDSCDVDGDGNDGNVGGAWSFRTLMANMANTPVTGVSTQQFIHEWIINWMTTDTSVAFPVPARPNIKNFFVGWDGVNASTLDIDHLPFRLIAIVNRIDLADSLAYGVGNPGEIRFVFGLVNPSSCVPAQMTVILEYGDVIGDCFDLKARAEQWLDLDSLPLGTSAYNAALQDITDDVTKANADTDKPNASAINQVRTNDIAFAGPWELREFGLQGVPRLLQHASIKQTPDPAIFRDPGLFGSGSAELAQYMEQEANDILCERQSVPEQLEFPAGSGTMIDFLGFSARYGFGTFWTAPTDTAALPTAFPSCHVANATFTVPETPVEIRSEVRHKLSLNTCDDCHSGETGTGFTHVSPSTTPAALSGFLTGISVVDPAGAGVIRTFDDLTRRAEVLEELATKSCLTFGFSLHALEVVPTFIVH
jgi:hypothetical protein